MELNQFDPQSDDDIQEALDHLRYSEEAHLGIISPKTQLNTVISCVEYLLKRVQDLESSLEAQ